MASRKAGMVPPPTATAASVAADVGAMMGPALEKIFASTVVDTARSYADAAALPEEFRDGVEMRKDPSTPATAAEWSLVNTFKGKFGEPLAEWFEEGTKRFYKIRPKVDHPQFGFGDSQPVIGTGHIAREGDDDPRNIYTERDVAHVEHGDDTSRQHPSVLHWFRYGSHHYRKEVTHPGRQPTAAMAMALENSIEEARRAAEAALPEVEGYELKIELELVGEDG